MKRGGIAIGLMLLVAVLLLAALGLVPYYRDTFADVTTASLVNGQLTANVPGKAQFSESCGMVNGVNMTCADKLVCSNGHCVKDVGSDCEKTSDCVYGSVCTNFTAGSRTFNLCLRPQAAPATS